ncbi:MAG TPA: hypothetical protein VN682_11455 [Terriglobales bacterium]|nr:hypothetical protein [Terriglobales bacterium]
MVRIRLKLGLVILATGLGVTAVRAQQEVQDQSSQDQPNQGQQQTQSQQTPDQNQGQPQQPIPAYRSPMGGPAGEDNSAPAVPYERDTRPLAGIENVSAGVPGDRRSYLSPYLSVLASGESNSLRATDGGWLGYGSVIGGMDMERLSRSSDFGLQYVGGGSFSRGSGVGASVLQRLGITETLRWRRNSLTLEDLFGYFPETSFGYGGVIGSPGLTSITGGIQSVFLPGDSILTAAGQRVTNTSLAEMDIGLSARSSFTLVGGYSFLRFLDNDLFDYAGINARVGYNYRMTRRDTIAVYYQFDQLRYSARTGTIENHLVEMSYGHQITGRLAFQAAAGPEISSYPNSVITGGVSTNSTTRISWSMNTGLTYQQQERTSLGLQYSHGVSGGSGIFLGAQSDRVSGTVNHQLPGMEMRLTGGYSRNRGLKAAGVTSSGQVYDYWFGGVNFDRPLSRRWELRLAYELQYQQSNVAFCISTPCGTSFTRHLVTLGVNWKGQRIPF